MRESAVRFASELSEVAYVESRITPAPEIVAPEPIVISGLIESVNTDRWADASLSPLTRRRAPSPLRRRVSELWVKAPDETIIEPAATVSARLATRVISGAESEEPRFSMVTEGVRTFISVPSWVVLLKPPMRRLSAAQELRIDSLRTTPAPEGALPEPPMTYMAASLLISMAAPRPPVGWLVMTAPSNLSALFP